MTFVVSRAVIVDQWALVRLGIAAVLTAREVEQIVEFEHGRDGIAWARAEHADLIVLGNHLDRPAVDVVLEAATLTPPPKVALLLTNPAREELGALLAAGADALLQRSVAGDELADALDRIERGERVIAPALLPTLVGAMAPSDPAPDSLLTGKEREVLAALAAGGSNQQIAEALFVTRATIKTHLAHIYAKLDARDRHEAIARAVAMGLLT
jgi:DNA-binding NarL/FixJ family response regulator